MASLHVSRDDTGRRSSARAALEGALAFGVGGLLMVVMDWRLWILGVVGIPLSGAVGGAWVGSVVKETSAGSLKGAAAFGFGFSPTTLVFLLLIVGLQGTGKVNSLGLLLTLTVGFAVLFGVAGALSGALLRVGGRFVLASLRAFAIGGAVGGLILGACLWIAKGADLSRKAPRPALRARAPHAAAATAHYSYNWPRSVLFIGLASGILGPYFLGGALLGSAVPAFKVGPAGTEGVSSKDQGPMTKD